MRFRALASAFLVAAVLLSWSSSELAAAATVPRLSVSLSSGPPGVPVTITGTGFCSVGCSTVTIEFDGSPADEGIQVAPDGSFQVTAGVGGASGSVEILATQQRDPPNQGTVQAFTYFVVTPGAPPPGSTNPSTPAPSSPAATTTTSRPTRQAGSTTTSSSTTTTTKSNGSTTSTALGIGASPPSKSDSGGLPAGAIAGIAIGAALVLTGAVFWWLRTRRRVHTSN